MHYAGPDRFCVFQNVHWLYGRVWGNKLLHSHLQQFLYSALEDDNRGNHSTYNSSNRYGAEEKDVFKPTSIAGLAKA